MSNFSDRYTSLEKTAFISYLFVILWAPIPFASNRSWALSLVEILIFFICILLYISFLNDKLSISDVVIKAKPLLLLLFAWLAIQVLHIIPFPPALIEIISPVRFDSSIIFNKSQEWITLSESRYDSVQYLIQSLAYISFLLLSLQLINTRKRIKIVAYTIIYSALFQSMYGSLMTISGIEYGLFEKKNYGIGVATGTFVNQNHLAGYLNIGIAVAIGILVSRFGRGGRISSYKQLYTRIVSLLLSTKTTLRIYITLMAITVVLTHSRMGNAALLISLSITILLSLCLTHHAKRTMAILALSIIIIDVLFISSWYGLDTVAERIEQTTYESSIRDEVAISTIMIFKDYLIFGSGGGTFDILFPKYRDAEIKLFFDHAHNDFLEIASETGVLGISMIGFSVLLTFFVCIKALSTRNDPLMIGLAFSSIMAIISLTIHSAVDFNLQIPANALTFVILLSFGWISYYKTNNHNSSHQR